MATRSARVMVVATSCRFGGRAYEWLDENGSDFGWHNPPWARAGGSKPEAWHWEFDPSLID